jgi:hypothetical protein
MCFLLAIVVPGLAGFVLESEPHRQLNQPGILRPSYLSKGRSVRDIPVGAKELRVVEHVENLGTQLKIHALSQRNNFVNREVQVRRARAAANGAPRIANLSEGSFSKR